MEIQLIFMVLAFFQTIFPLFLSYRFITRAQPSRWHLLVTALTLIFFYTNLFLNSPWHFIGLPWRYLLLGQIVWIAVRVLRVWRVTEKLKFGEPRRGRWVFIVWIFFGAHQVRQVSLLMQAHRPQEPSVEFIFPLTGASFVIGQGGAGEVTNHHFFHPEQKHALDIVAVNPMGISRNKFFSPAAQDFIVYEQRVIAPCEGVVVKAIDGEPDQKPWDLSVMNTKLKEAYGNSLTLQCGEYRVSLAHLRQGSLLVKNGDLIKAGQELARVGNSGRSTEPHLHIHTTRHERGVPMRFAGRYFVRGNVVAP